MHIRFLLMILVAATSLIACGGGEEPAAQVAAPDTQQQETAVVEPVAEEVSEGSFVFEADGEAKRFEYLPAGDNYYTAVASAVRARPAAGADEELGIIFMSLDLKKVTYPVDLPAPRGAGTPKDPVIARSTIGFSFTNENGEEWAGPGTVRVEAFGQDGMIECTFTDVSLPHTDKALPNIVLTEGHFRARITSPW